LCESCTHEVPARLVVQQSNMTPPVDSNFDVVMSIE
jgi:hypothetical protein